MNAQDTKSRLKVWEKPTTTSYEGDFSGDLRKLAVNLEFKVYRFFSSLHTSICASNPSSGKTCWDGLNERVNKKKVILDFTDEFAPFPNRNEEVTHIIDQIKRIRNEVLKIFLKSNSKQSSGDTELGSGSGDGEMVTDDTEPDSAETEEPAGSTPVQPSVINVNNYHQNTVSGVLKVATGKPKSKEDYDSIELEEDVKSTTTKKNIAISLSGHSQIKQTEPPYSSAHGLRLTHIVVWISTFLVIKFIL